jgi:hypothetical protein
MWPHQIEILYRWPTALVVLGVVVILNWLRKSLAEYVNPSEKRFVIDEVPCGWFTLPLCVVVLAGLTKPLNYINVELPAWLIVLGFYAYYVPLGLIATRALVVVPLSLAILCARALKYICFRILFAVINLPIFDLVFDRIRLLRSSRRWRLRNRMRYGAESSRVATLLQLADDPCAKDVEAITCVPGALALQALAEREAEQLRQLAFRLLQHSWGKVRVNAVEILTDSGDTRIALLLPVIRLKRDIGSSVVDVLEEDSSCQSLNLEPLFSLLKEENCAAQSLLNGIETAGCSVKPASLLQFLKHRHHDVRVAAATIMRDGGDTRVDILMPLIRLVDGTIGEVIIDALCGDADSRTLLSQPIMGLLGDADADRHKAATEVILAFIEAGLTVERLPLYECFASRDVSIRTDVATILHAMGDKRVEFLWPLIELDCNLGAAIQNALSTGAHPNTMNKEPILRLLAYQERSLGSDVSVVEQKVRRAAADILAEAGDRRALQLQYMVSLGHEEAVAAVNALLQGEKNQLVSTEPLVKYFEQRKIFQLHSKSKAAREAGSLRFVQEILASGEPLTSERLRTFLGHKDCFVRTYAAYLLMMSGDKRLQQVMSILACDIDVNGAVIKALRSGDQHKTIDTKPIIALLPLACNQVRDSLETILTCGGEIAKKPLISHLTHSREEVRISAASLLEKSGDNRFNKIGPLIQLSAEMSDAGVQAVLEERTFATIDAEPLLKLMAASESRVRNQASDCLRVILEHGGARPTAELISLVGHREQSVRTSALNILNDFGNEQSKQLRTVLEAMCSAEDNEELAHAIIEVLEQSESTGELALAPLYKFRFDSNPKVRTAIARFFPEHAAITHSGHRYLAARRHAKRAPFDTVEPMSDAEVERLGRTVSVANLKELARSRNHRAITSFVGALRKDYFSSLHEPLLIELLDSLWGQVPPGYLKTLEELTVTVTYFVEVGTDSCNNPKCEKRTRVEDFPQLRQHARQMRLAQENPNPPDPPPPPGCVGAPLIAVCRCSVRYSLPPELGGRSLTCPVCEGTFFTPEAPA